MSKQNLFFTLEEAQFLLDFAAESWNFIPLDDTEDDFPIKTKFQAEDAKKASQSISSFRLSIHIVKETEGSENEVREGLKSLETIEQGVNSHYGKALEKIKKKYLQNTHGKKISEGILAEDPLVEYKG